MVGKGEGTTEQEGRGEREEGIQGGNRERERREGRLERRKEMETKSPPHPVWGEDYAP